MIVWSFFGDLDIMHMRFTDSRGCDFDEFSFGMHVADGAASQITHAGSDTSSQLVNDIGEIAFIRDASFHTFRYQFICLMAFGFLEIAVARSLLHGR